ncbi:MAG: cyclodeaminase/cyclohydrolase family protein, partial [Candidatus Omnitrophica bacterium]|nr:cyclodeaminase/cyclohydrolase family protein [Candidatus Omnitrophota bacterium]
YLVSDVHVARALLIGAIQSAVVNVRINLPYIEDKKFVSEVNEELKRLKL